MSEHMDALADIDEMIARAESQMTPRELADAREQDAAFERAVNDVCAWGWCTEQVDPVTNKIVCGWGPTACPHDHLPGWRSSYLDGQSKPPVPVKVAGRHGARVQRSRRRFVLPSYPGLVDEWLPARSRGED